MTNMFTSMAQILDRRKRRYEVLLTLLLATVITTADARTAFEKLTDYDYVGETYYTIKNLSLYECQGWCREEPECAAASFSFAVDNTGIPRQETICLLQNGTQANNPSTKPVRALNQYYMVKLSIRSDKVCKRPWNFERVPNAMIQGHDRALIFTSTKEACLAACLNERNFICRSAEYNYVTLQCRLSDYDRRTADPNFQPVELVESPGVDYFENLCLTGDNACEISRSYQIPKVGIPDTKVSLHVGIHYYVDKELMANSLQACRRACTTENEFLCRSFLYLGDPNGSDYNCKLYHLDHWTLADGINAFLNSATPLSIANGNRIGSYYENRCARTFDGGVDDSDTDLGPDESNTNLSDNTDVDKPTGDDLAAGGNVPSVNVPNGVDIGGSIGVEGSDGGDLTSGTTNQGGSFFGSTSSPTNGGLSGTSSGGLSGSSSGGLSGSSSGGLSGSSSSGPSGSSSGGLVGPTNGGSNVGLDSISGGSNNPNGGGSFGFDGQTGGQGSNSDIFGSNLDNFEFPENDVNCDSVGTCYDVTVHCKDTRIVVNVNTNRPFSGRIYALGRSETCNVDVINSDSFRLDLTMGGQDCNTQSANGVYTNTVVVQRHSVVMTKTDKIYKVRCTYDTSARNVTFGMMPIRDPDMISITSAPEAPAPKISILDERGSEVETVRIGDRLTFKIEIPENTPYGIFARSCVAMAKDSRSTFPIIDDEGCPIDPTIFPRFTPQGNALISVYEAFRFTESYGVIFQCNVKYCLGPCEPANCEYGRDNFESWGRKKRDISKRDISPEVEALVEESQMRLSHEIIVLDYGDEKTAPYEETKIPSNNIGLGNMTDFHVNPIDWSKTGEEVFAHPNEIEVDVDCPTKSSVMALAITCAILVVLYVCTVFCLCAKRSSSKSDKVMLEGRLATLGLHPHARAMPEYVR